MFRSIIIFIFILIVGCNAPESTFTTVDESINDVLQRFPMLPRNNETPSSYYSSIKKIILGQNNLEIDLRRSNLNKDFYEEIIVVRNKLGNYYSIPFFTNKYRDYWNFSHDTSLPNVPKTYSTFEKEYTKMEEKLALNRKESLIINGEIFESLLNCKMNIEIDSNYTYIPSPSAHYESEISENREDCIKRLANDFKIIKQDLSTQHLSFFSRYYDDIENQRIYKVSRKKIADKAVWIFDIYRQDCICCYPLSL